jgi:hypothetical protein
MGFFSNIKNRARGMANDLGPSNMPTDRQNAFVNPVRPGMDDGRAYAGGSPGLYAPGGRFNPGNIGGRISESSYSPLELAERKARARVEAGKQDLFQKNRKDRSKKQGGIGGLFRKLQEQIKNQQRPQQMPQQNLDFLSRLPQNMMPQVDFSNIPQLPENFKFNPQMGQMTPGYAVGGPLMGRAANLSRQVLNKSRIGRDLPGRATSNMGDMVLGTRGASPFTDSLRRGTEDFLMGATAGGTLGAAAIGLDGTQTLREPFSKDNVSFMSPEAFGKDMAQLRMDVGAVINLAKNKAVEMGEDINDYVSRARSAYDQQMNQDMENQRMQEIDAQQGMQPFSMLMGPNMPLSNRDREILGETGRTISDMDRGYIDDILSDLEKKN